MGNTMHSVLLMVTLIHMCHSLAGFGALLPGTTLGRTGLTPERSGAGRNDDTIQDGVRILIY